MKYMLDTNICIYAIKNNPSKIINKISKLNSGDLCISIITYCELMYGVENSKKKDMNKVALNTLLSNIEILNCDVDSANCFAQIRSELKSKGNIIGDFDLLIAAHAKSKGLTLVTNNIKEFNRVKGLKIENWV